MSENQQTTTPAISFHVPFISFARTVSCFAIFTARASPARPTPAPHSSVVARVRLDLLLRTLALLLLLLFLLLLGTRARRTEDPGDLRAATLAAAAAAVAVGGAPVVRFVVQQDVGVRASAS